MTGSISCIGNPNRQLIHFDQLPVVGRMFSYRDQQGARKHTERLVSVIDLEAIEVPYSTGMLMQDSKQSYILLFESETSEKTP